MKALGEDVEGAGMAGDWKHERLEADDLLRSLHLAYSEDEKHRKWLLRRWPEWPREVLSGSLPDPERFIPECYLREGEDDVSGSLQSIKTLVRKSFNILQEEDGEDQQLFVQGLDPRLSEEGVREAIPLLLPRLKRQVLHSILSILSGRKREARNRQWLIKRINEDWTQFWGRSHDSSSLETWQKILAVVRGPSAFREAAVSGRLLLEEASCPWSAARSALTDTQLYQLPLQCLHVMLEVILGKPPEAKVGKLPVGGNKDRLVAALLKNGRALLPYEEKSEALPAALRKSLVVMSLSARYAFGEDGNLIGFLGPLPPETTLLQSNLLSGLYYLKSLNYKNLLAVHRVLIGEPKLYRKRHPGNIRHSIRRILLDCLLRSEVRSVPEEVKTIAVTIGSLARKQPSENKQKGPENSALKVTHSVGARVDVEIESTLRISSHLLQIMYNWNEVLSERSSKEQKCHKKSPGSAVGDCNLIHDIGTFDATENTTQISLSTGIISNGIGAQVKDQSLVVPITDEDDGDDQQTSIRLLSDSFDETGQLGRPDETTPTRNDNQDDGEDVEIDRQSGVEDLGLTKIADEASEVAYALIGCAMERIARSSGVSLKRPVRKYLRTGIKRKVRSGPAEGTDVEQHQLAMILKIAEKIPAISPRVIDNVKRRIGMG